MRRARARWPASSSVPSATRASPCAWLTRNARASGERVSCALPRPRSASASARSTSAPTSSASSGSRTSTRVRDSRAGITSNDGFSVVAPMRTMVPRSTWGRNASCCALLKRWISSTKSSVGRPLRASSSAASATIWRSSFTPCSTAEKVTVGTPLASPSSWASVVFPVPGGPHRISDSRRPLARRSRSTRPGPSRCCWPTNSSTVRGRMRSASGARPLALAVGVAARAGEELRLPRHVRRG